MCKRFADDTIAIQRFMNPGDHHPPVPAGSEQGGTFTPLPSKFVDGIITCQYNLSNFDTQNMERYDTLRPLSQSGKYHPLFAVGILNSTGTKIFFALSISLNIIPLLLGDPQYHDGREPQPGLVQLNQDQNLMFKEKDSLMLD